MVDQDAWCVIPGGSTLVTPWGGNRLFLWGVKLLSGLWSLANALLGDSLATMGSCSLPL